MDRLGFEERSRGSCTDVDLMIGQALRRGYGLQHKDELGAVRDMEEDVGGAQQGKSDRERQNAFECLLSSSSRQYAGSQRSAAL